MVDRRLWWLYLALFAPTACVGSDGTPLADFDLTASDAAVPRISEQYLQGQRELDLLLVMDNSRDMGPTQQLLVSQLDPLLTQLAQTFVDYRIGVVSTDLGIDPHSGPGCTTAGGDGARLQSAPRVPGCLPPGTAYLESSAGGDIALQLACIGQLGEGGCGFERPFDAALRALTPELQPATNQGFRRPGAALLVLFVTDEDDCSAADPRIYDPDAQELGPWTSYRCFEHDIHCTGRSAGGALTGCTSGHGAYLVPVAQVAQQLAALASPGRVGVVAVSGPAVPVLLSTEQPTHLEPACTSSLGVQAVPAVRLAELAQAFGPRGATVSLCSTSLGQDLAQAAAGLQLMSGPYCLQHALRDATRPQCKVAISPPGGSPRGVPPSGAGGAGFRIVHPPGSDCVHGALVFDPGAAPAAGEQVTLTCDFVGEP